MNERNRYSGYEILLVSLMFFTAGTINLDRVSQLFLGPYLVPAFHLTSLQIGQLASTLSICWAIGTFVFGALSDRYGRRTVIVPSMFIIAALSIAAGFAQSFHQLLVLRGLMGLAEGPSLAIAYALVRSASRPTHIARNVAITSSATGLMGLTLAPILITQLASHFGWRLAFMFAGVPAILASVLLLIMVREPEVEMLNGARHRPTLRDYAEVIKTRNILLCCMGQVGLIAWTYLQHTFGPLYLTKVRHLAPTEAGFMLGVSSFGGVVTGFLYLELTRLWGRKRILVFISIISIAVPLAYQVSYFYDHRWLLYLIIVACNPGLAVPSLIAIIIPTDSVPRRMAGSAIGVVLLSGELLGNSFLPTLSGKLSQHYGLATGLRMATLGAVLTLIVALLLHYPDEEQRQAKHDAEDAASQPVLSFDH